MWLHNFLSNRQQCVAINGTTSSEAQVKSGVPQGSVLGPLLFLIHISVINYEIAHSTVSYFADDTRILLGIKDEEDTQIIIIIIIIKRGWQCKAGRERLTPYQSEDPNPTTHRKKEEKGKTVGDKK